VILLDTHALAWGIEGAGKAVEPRENHEGNRPSSANECRRSLRDHLRGATGRWPEAEIFLDVQGIDLLSVTGALMQRAGALDWSHRDPFDRMIVATALEEGMAVVSKDATLDTIADTAFRRFMIHSDRRSFHQKSTSA